MELVPIGIFYSCFTDKFGTPRQPGLVPSSEGYIELNKNLQPKEALSGLTAFSHIWVIFSFHKNTNLKYRPKVHPPRLEGGTIGVFATRSPHRPNPLGLSVCKLESIIGGKVFVSGIDLIDQTPVYDIKPYLPNVEKIRGAFNRLEEKLSKYQNKVVFSREASVFLKSLNKLKALKLRRLIKESLQSDPRPLAYKKNLQKQHVFSLYQFDVYFSVSRIEPLSEKRISCDQVIGNFFKITQIKTKQPK